jgi:arylsulfatase A-like enzyme
MLLLALAHSCACSRPTPIVVIAVDTLRADHLSVYGYPRDTSPEIAGLAADAIVFTRAFTTAPKTSPAFASMFTGLYPFRHGLERLGQALAEENVTAAELLAARGYRTAAFVSSTVMIDRLSDLGQGFAVWDDLVPQREANRDNFERTADATVAATLEWLRGSAHARRSFFLLTHLIDPHGPYSPPGGFRRRFQRGGGRRLEQSKVPAFQRLPDAHTVGDYVDAYDAEILFADTEIGRLLADLRERGIYDEALIVLTADHGESFGSDGVYFRHGPTLAEATTRIPLIVKPPGNPRGAGPRFRDDVVSLVDLLPTLLDYAGTPVPDDLDGRSLRPLIESDASFSGRVVFSSRRSGGSMRLAAHGPRTTLRDSVPRERIETSRALGGSRADATEWHLLDEALDEQARKIIDHRLPFDVDWRYRPTDKEFVREFVAEHNARAATAEDLRALRRLGYIE